MVKIKNMVSDLTPEQRGVKLEQAAMPARGYVGQTLGDFIAGEMLENVTLTDLMEEMAAWNLRWPFRYLAVTVEVTVSRGYYLAVLDDETVDGFAKGDILLDEIDPNFNLESAYDETLSDAGDYANHDYAVEDDEGRCLVDWDN